MNIEQKRPVTHRPSVKTKMDFVRRYKTGEFGNASPTWNSYKDWWEDWQEDGWEDRLYHIRNRVAGGPTWYNVTADRLAKEWERLVRVQGVDPKSLYISEMAPTEKTLLQGEVRRSERGLELTYTRVKKPLRYALAEETLTVHGLSAKMLMYKDMCSNSYGWLMELLDEYPDHVVEFSVYSEPWGTIPGYNTVFWEIRLYSLLNYVALPLAGLLSFLGGIVA